MAIQIPQPVKEQLAKRYYQFLEGPYVNYYNLRSKNRTGHEKAAAMAAAKDIYHFREWLPTPLNDFNTVIAACPDYGLLGDVTVVDKHFEQNKKNKYREPLLKSKDDIQEVDIVTWYNDAHGSYHNQQQAVLLRLQAGPMTGYRRDILSVLTNVINYWIDVLHENGMIRDNQHFPFVEANYVPREAARRIHFNLSNMYPHEAEVLHVVYDAQSNKLLPIDPSVPRLTGYRIDWDSSTGEYTVKAKFEPEDNAEGWTLTAEDANGNVYPTTEQPVVFKTGH